MPLPIIKQLRDASDSGTADASINELLWKAADAIGDLEEALSNLMIYGCPDCGGDCAAANPPVLGCPMKAAFVVLEKLK